MHGREKLQLVVRAAKFHSGNLLRDRLPFGVILVSVARVAWARQADGDPDASLAEERPEGAFRRMVRRNRTCMPAHETVYGRT